MPFLQLPASLKSGPRSRVKAEIDAARQEAFDAQDRSARLERQLQAERDSLNASTDALRAMEERIRELEDVSGAMPPAGVIEDEPAPPRVIIPPAKPAGPPPAKASGKGKQRYEPDVIMVDVEPPAEPGPAHNDRRTKQELLALIAKYEAERKTFQRRSNTL